MLRGSLEDMHRGLTRICFSDGGQSLESVSIRSITIHADDALYLIPISQEAIDERRYGQYALPRSEC